MSRQFICDGCKKPVSISTEVKVGLKKFDVCDACKLRILEFFARPKTLMSKIDNLIKNT